MMQADSEGSGQAVSGLPSRRERVLLVADAKETWFIAYRFGLGHICADLRFSSARICENFFLIPICNLATGG